ncbi:MAG: protein nirF [bacterium]|nr:protein nirF [bacterium]
MANTISRRVFAFLILTLFLISPTVAGNLRGTGDLGLIVERAAGSIQIIETTNNTSLGRIKGLGDLSHASAVFSRDARFAFIFGRDGGLTKVDLLTRKIVKRVIQGGNSIGGAISDDGRMVAVSNYSPGGVKIFRTDTLEMIADIPATYGQVIKKGTTTITISGQSKTVGLVDAPGKKFVFSLYNAGEIWVADCSKCLEGVKPKITKFKNVGKLPYDGLITGDGRTYIAGLFGEDGMVKLDLWQDKLKAERILDGYGKGEKKLPVYKMPHLEGWALAGNRFFLPAIGHHELLVMDAGSFKQIGSFPVYGQPVFAMARPDGRQIWVNFAHPRNDTVQVIDTHTMKLLKEFKPGKAVLHMEFTPRGEQVWISVRDADRIDIYDTKTLKLVKSLPAQKPSGIFFAARAMRTGL